MTRTSPIQTAFNSGELSPLLYGRMDYARFQTGLRVCNGFLPLRQGGITRAPGTTFEGNTRNNRRARLMSFEFAIDDSVLIEVTANVTAAPSNEPPGGTMRFWRYGQLIENNGSPYELQVPFNQASIDRMQWVQSADVIYIVDGTQPIQRLERRALDDWAIVPLDIDDGPFRVGNVDKDQTVQVIVPDIVSGSGNLFDPDSIIRGVAAEGDVLQMTFTAGLVTPDMIGTLMQIEPFEYVDVPLFLSNTSAKIGEFMRANGNIYRLVGGSNGSDPGTATNTGFVAPSHIEGNQITDRGLQTVWEFVSDDRGVVRIDAIVDATTATVTVLRTVPPPCCTAPTYRWSESAWSPKVGYPSAIALYEQRLVAAATPTDPRTIWFSTVGAFNSFGGRGDADDGFAYGVAGSTSLNRIIWLKPGRRGLHVGALGEEFSVRSNTQGQVIGPTTFELGVDSSIGAHSAMAIAPDGKPIFIAKDRRRVYEMRYAFDQDANLPIELSLPAEHLGRRRFEQIVWQAGEQRLAWLRMADGTLTVMIHDPQEDVLGWARLTIAGGLVESLAVYSDPATSRDILTMTVRRFVNGIATRTMERLAPVFALGDDDEDAADAHHLFAATNFVADPPARDFVVPQLAGRTVAAWTEEGSFVGIEADSAGNVTLPAAVGRALIGLADNSHQAETLPIRAAIRDGDATGRQQRLLPGHGLRVHKTGGGTIATIERDPDRDDHVNEAIPIVPDTIASRKQQLFSGVLAIEAKTGVAKEVSFRVKPEGGAPMSVLTLTAMIDEEGG